MRRIILVGVAMSVGCGGVPTAADNEPESPSQTVDEDSPETDDEGEASDEGGCGSDAQPPYACAPFDGDQCWGDGFPYAECEDGAWGCPPGTVRVDDCPSNSCLGFPLPGEVCDDDGWACEPTLENYDECPSLMCLTCDGFTPRFDTNCECECQDGSVSCVRTE